MKTYIEYFFQIRISIAVLIEKQSDKLGLILIKAFAANSFSINIPMVSTYPLTMLLRSTRRDLL